jgi:serine/threonine protein kinase
MKPLADTALDRLRAAADMPDLTGTRYRLLEKLGQGGMGDVYRVEDPALGRQVALKVISVPDSGGELATRLLREARVIAQLEHPGIVPVHDVGTLPDGRVFYTMKLVQGLRLDQYLAQPGTLAERLRIFERICQAVSFAHAHGVLHRDLKPQNIMVGPFGEVLVMDWGLSKFLRARNQPETASLSPASVSETVPRPNVASAGPQISAGTAHGTVLGTPGYMAPEQARGDTRGLDHRADVYSLGAILRFLLGAAVISDTKTTATNPDTPSIIPAVGQPGAPRALAAVSNKAMSPDPADRYATVQDLANDVAHYLDGLPVSAYPESRLVRLWRWTMKNRAWILLIVAYLVMRMLFILWRR